MRIFGTSDLHTDFRENFELIKQLSEVEYQQDVLIVAGDIADQLDIIRETLSLLRSRFQRVFFMPGNHELWLRNGGTGDSIQKLNQILQLCDSIDVDTKPAKPGDNWIVPLFSWYEASFDTGDAEETQLAAWADFYFCKWPIEASNVASFFLKLNETRIRTYDAPVVSFSHFLPRPELLPPVEYLRFKGLPRVAGCNALDDQIRSIGSRTHLFGHSHIPCDKVIDGVRYLQHSLRYPKERKTESFPIKMILDESELPADEASSLAGSTAST